MDGLIDCTTPSRVPLTKQTSCLKKMTSLEAFVVPRGSAAAGAVRAAQLVGVDDSGKFVFDPTGRLAAYLAREMRPLKIVCVIGAYRCVCWPVCSLLMWRHPRITLSHVHGSLEAPCVGDGVLCTNLSSCRHPPPCPALMMIQMWQVFVRQPTGRYMRRQPL